MENFSFVIPVYNEEQNIPVLYQKITEEMKKIGDNWEIIFVNDGSKDRSLEVLQEFAKNDKRVKWIDLSRNFGHQAALTAGLDQATGDAVISLDCDMQDPPEIIGQMIEEWRKGYEIVYARRKNRQDAFLKKYTAIWYYQILYRFSETQIPRNVADFRLIDKVVLKELRTMTESSRYLRGMVSWLGFSHTFVDFDRPERLHGVAGYSWEKSLKLAMDGIMNFSLAPMKVAFWLGILFNMMGFLFLNYMLYDTIFKDAHYELIKWLTVAIFMATGLQYVLIWILGEYVGRIYEESKNRPVYVINKKGNLDENPDA